jgi:hypothetical protein
VWQDYAIAIVVMVFTLTTIPMIRSNAMLPVGTSLPMILGGIVLVVAYSTLGLWLSLCVEIISCALWTILLMRKLRNATVTN